MSYSQLISAYSPTGDIITLVMVITSVIIIQQSLFITSEYSFDVFKRATLFLGLAAAANLMVYELCLMPVEHVAAIYIGKMANMIALLVTMLQCVIYIRNLVTVEGLDRTIVTYITKIIVWLSGLLVVLMPFTHFGYYRDASGLWYRSEYLTPFGIAYIACVGALLCMLVKYRKNFIKQISYVMMVVVSLCVVIVAIDDANLGNTYLCFSFMVPMMIVLIMIHSRPYDLVTGAMSPKAFDNYLEQVVKNRQCIDYVVMELDMVNNHELPQDFGRSLYNFATYNLRKALIFNPRPGLFIMAAEKRTQDSLEEKQIIQWIYEVCPRFYEKYGIDYKIQVYKEIDFVADANQLLGFIDIRSKMMENRDVFIATNTHIEQLRQAKYIISQLEDIAEKGDLNDERVLVYCQPVKNVQTGEFDTAEALMRLTLPEMGMVFPDQFIPIAERLGCIHDLSKIILNKTCMNISKMIQQGYQFSRISVNFSISEFKYSGFCDEVVSIINEHKIPTGKVAIELTESTNDEDFQLLYRTIHELKRHGIQFYLDDFGTGYSNFDRILSLGLDIVKFDRSLLLFADRDKNIRFTLHHFASAFAELNYKVLFEGVETDEHESLCTECFADYLQGYKFSKPVPIEQYANFLKVVQ